MRKSKKLTKVGGVILILLLFIGVAFGVTLLQYYATQEAEITTNPLFSYSDTGTPGAWTDWESMEELDVQYTFELVPNGDTVSTPFGIRTHASLPADTYLHLDIDNQWFESNSGDNSIYIEDGVGIAYLGDGHTVDYDLAADTDFNFWINATIGKYHPTYDEPKSIWLNWTFTDTIE